MHQRRCTSQPEKMLRAMRREASSQKTCRRTSSPISLEDLEDTSLENPSDLTTAPTLGVPILNILGWTQAGYQDGKSTDEGKTAARRGGVQRLPGGEQSGRRLSSIVGSHWTPQRDPTRGVFTRQDIESSDGTTLTGSQAFDQVPPGRGYETRVEGYGSPREKEGEKMTQPLPTSDHSEPVTMEDLDRRCL